MSNITESQVLARFKENAMDYAVIDLENDSRLIVSRYGGRIIGPFDPQSGESLVWLCKPFLSEELFRRYYQSGRISLGGERLWIAPEFTFYTKERESFDETYLCQSVIDPGRYSLVKTGDTVRLSMYVSARSYGMKFSTKEFFVERQVRRAENPFRFLREYETLMSGVQYCGYRQSVYIKDCSPDKKMYLEPWLVMQLDPGGSFIIPYTGAFEFDDYYEPVNETIQQVYSDYVVMKTTGKRKYKVGFKSVKTTGRSAYSRRINDDRYLLVIKSYDNDPSTSYCMEPWREHGVRGCSLFIYDDTGNSEDFGGFTEYEHCGLTLGFENNRDESVSEASHYFFIGEKKRLLNIMESIMGINYVID